MAEEDAGGTLMPTVEETWLDRLIGFFSPERRARRLRGRAMGNILAGGYQGASGSRRSMKEWDAAAGSADAKILSDLRTLRGRSRDLSRNSPYATGAVNTNVMSVVGGGIRVNPSIDRDVLGIDGEEAEAWERRAQTIFRTWAQSEEADLTRVSNFYGLQNLAFRSVLESGDVLVIRRFNRREGDVLGLQVQLVEADRISNPHGKVDRNNLAGGVEKNEDGEPVAYHVREEHPGDSVLRIGIAGSPINRWTRVPARSRRTDELLSFLLYERKRPGQSRGVPYLAPVIEELKQLDRYSEAELMATVLSSMLTVFVKAETDLYGPEGGGSFGMPDQPPGDDSSVEDGDVHLGQGAVMELAPGEDIETVDPLRPNEAFADFEAAILKQVGAGLDIPLEVLQKHFQSSFSAARGALLEAWRAFLTRREWLTSRFCDRVYRWAITEAVERGMLSAPGFFEDPVARQAWLGTQWIGPSRGTIRPDREVKAAKERVEAGFSTRARETAAMTGEDWDRVHEKRKREERMRRESEMTGSAEGEAGAAAGREA